MKARHAASIRAGVLEARNNLAMQEQIRRDALLHHWGFRDRADAYDRTVRSLSTDPLTVRAFQRTMSRGVYKGILARVRTILNQGARP